jgi:hypothetical protein
VKVAEITSAITTLFIAGAFIQGDDDHVLGPKWPLWAVLAMIVCWLGLLLHRHFLKPAVLRAFSPPAQL